MLKLGGIGTPMNGRSTPDVESRTQVPGARRPGLPSASISHAALAAGLLLLGLEWAQAQELVMPPTPQAPSPVPAAPRAGIVQLGSFDVLVRAGAAVYYDDNIFLDDTNEVDDVVWSLMPGFTVAASDMTTNGGKSLTISYDPRFQIFTDHGGQNTINHAARVSGALAFTKLALGLNQTITAGTDPVVESGTRSDHLLSGTELSSRYAFGEKLSAEMNFGLTLSDYSEQTSAWDWWNRDWVNYQYSDRLNLGLGLALGYIDMKGFSDQNYEELQVRAIYQASDKVDVNATVGLDWRQYRSGVDDTLAPIWDVAAVYRPRESTSLRLGLYQRYYSSAYYGNQNYVSTGVDVGWHQTFRTRYAFDLAARYHHSDYEATEVGVAADRTDDVFAVRPQFELQINDRWRASAYYEFSQNTSDDRPFTRNVVGLQALWAY
jgi:hypothetical protein